MSTCSVTKAVRDTVVDGLEIKLDNDMGIEDNHCVICQAFYPGADNFFIRNSCTSGDKYTAFKHSIKDFVLLAIAYLS